MCLIFFFFFQIPRSRYERDMPEASDSANSDSDFDEDEDPDKIEVPGIMISINFTLYSTFNISQFPFFQTHRDCRKMTSCT